MSGRSGELQCSQIAASILIMKIDLSANPQKRCSKGPPVFEFSRKPLWENGA